MVIVKDQPLRLFADFLIRNGMFDAKGGRFSGLLVAYQNALISNADKVKVSFIMQPNIGIAILLTGRADKPQFNLYTNHKLRRQGIARDHTARFLSYMGKDSLDDVECTELVDDIIEEAKIMTYMMKL